MITVSCKKNLIQFDRSMIRRVLLREMRTCLCEYPMLYDRSNVSYLFSCSLFRKFERYIPIPTRVILFLRALLSSIRSRNIVYRTIPCGSCGFIDDHIIRFRLGQVYTCAIVYVRCRQDRCYALILCLYIHILTDCKKKQKNYENVYCRACDAVVKENRSGCRKILIFNNALYLYLCRNPSAI